MTNYLRSFRVAGGIFALVAGGLSAAADKPAAAPAKIAPPTAPIPSPAPRFVQAPTGNTLGFAFMQAGAENHGVFKQFAVELQYDEKNLAASKLLVKVQIPSLDTQDQERDTTLASAELFDAQKFPAAHFTSSSITRRADGSLAAAGKLSLRGVTQDLTLPLSLKAAGNGHDLTGSVTIKRLDFGIGQGEWKSTEWVSDEVKISYKVRLVPAGPAPGR
jgi:polyisoprenoid-binding protein YceI